MPNRIENSKQPIILFILGLPRSGTHLLRFALDKNADIQFVPETAILYKYWGSRTLGILLGRKFTSKMLARAMVANHGDPTMMEFAEREPNITQALLAPPSISACGDALNSFFLTKTRYIGEKSPNNSLFIKNVLQKSSDRSLVRLVLLKRDPYDQIASSIRSSHIGGGVIAALARYYVYNKALSDLKCYQVSYEQLVIYPEQTLRRLCEHLEIEFSKEMLRPGVLDSSESQEFFQQGDFGFIPDSIGKGRKRMTSESLELIDTYFEFGFNGLDVGSKWRFIIHVLLLRRNQLSAWLGIVMFKTAIKTFLLRLQTKNSK